MGMSLHVSGVKPPDAKWKKMKAVWDACKSAKVNVPAEVHHFFGGEEPDSLGVVVDEDALKRADAVVEIAGDGREGFEVDLTKLPADIKILRFVAAW